MARAHFVQTYAHSEVNLSRIHSPTMLATALIAAGLDPSPEEVILGVQERTPATVAVGHYCRVTVCIVAVEWNSVDASSLFDFASIMLPPG